MNGNNRTHSARPQFARPHSLADDFFLIAWDTVGSGAPRLHPQIAALGLAGALLGELVLAERIAIRGSDVWVLDRRPVRDRLAQSVLNKMAESVERVDARSWLAFLARNSVTRVAVRLTDAGLVERERSRLLFRTRFRYVANDWAVGAWPTIRLQTMLVKGQRMTPADMALAGLVQATELMDSVVQEARDRPVAAKNLGVLAGVMPPPLRDIAGHVEVATGDAVLSYRA